MKTEEPQLILVWRLR